MEFDNFIIGQREQMRGELAKKQMLLPRHRGEDNMAKKAVAASQT